MQQLERKKRAHIEQSHLSLEVERRNSAYSALEPRLLDQQRLLEEAAWEEDGIKLNELADALRLHALTLRAKTEKEEQAALEAAMHKLVERQTERQLTIALRGEKDRRTRWSQLEAINMSLGTAASLGRQVCLVVWKYERTNTH